MSDGIQRILTDISALSNPSTEQAQPVIGFKNPGGAGAIPAVVQMVNGAAGVEVLQTVTDATITAGESPSTRRLIPVMSRLTAYEGVNNEFLPVMLVFPQEGNDDQVNLVCVASWPQMLASSAPLYAQPRVASAEFVSALSGQGAQLVAEPGEWAVNSEPAVSTQASASRAAGGAGVRHVCRSLHFSLNAVAAQANIYARVRDGASGAGTILWSQCVVAPAGGYVSITLSGLNIVGSANTAMTFEFSAAPTATNFQTAGGSGYTAS